MLSFDRLMTGLAAIAVVVVIAAGWAQFIREGYWGIATHGGHSYALHGLAGLVAGFICTAAAFFGVRSWLRKPPSD